MLKDDDGNLISVELELARSDFEGMIAKDVARSMEIVQTAIRNAGESMTADQIDLVLLVGGSSYIPLVQKSLADLFGREKLRMDVDPMKCVAFGAAIVSHKWNEKVECEKGHVNPGKNSVCEVPGCGAPLNSEITIADGVTGMPYGIRTRAEKITCPKGHENPGKNRRCSVDGCGEGLVGGDDCFEEIIEKGTSFPMEKPKTKRFWTPAANLKRLCVPIYAGSNPVASRNEMQATVWLELPDHVAEATPVDVAFSLDEDGVLREVLVALMDGSGTKVKSMIGRGGELRDRLERKLEELRKRKEEARGTLDASVEGQWEALYGQAARALNANDAATAASCAAQMDGLVQSKEPEWKLKAMGLCNWTEMVLDYSYLLDPPKTEQLKKLTRELRACIERDDEEATARKFKELDAATDELPGSVQMLMFLLQKVGLARRKGMVVEAEQVLNVLHEVEAAFRANDFSRGKAKLESIDALLKKIGGPGDSGPDSTGPINQDFLQGGKSGSR
jgi:molecular chaperone DnaK (HSP70)